jgi:hypothetical protein
VDPERQIDEAATGQEAVGRADVDDTGNIATVYREPVSRVVAGCDGAR